VIPPWCNRSKPNDLRESDLYETSILPDPKRGMAEGQTTEGLEVGLAVTVRFPAWNPKKAGPIFQLRICRSRWEKKLVRPLVSGRVFAT